MAVAPAIALRLADVRDRFLLRSWIHDRAAGLWTTSRAGAEASIALALDQPTAMPRIASSNGSEISYMHMLDPPRAQKIGSALPAGDIPAGAMMMDVIIAPRAAPSADEAGAVIDAFAAEVFATSLTIALTAAIPLRLESAVRAFERAGFRWCHIDRSAGGEPSWLMRRDRSEPVTSAPRR